MNKYKFYMSRFVDNQWEEAVSLEDYFPGLIYLSCKGLSDKGKIKNIYTESFAEVEELRTYIPTEIVRENTDIEFEFGFKKDNRRDVYDNFVDWISGYRIKYWDTARNREVEMILIEKIEIDEDLLIGDSPFIVAPFKFKNIRGHSEAHDPSSPSWGGEDKPLTMNVLYGDSDYVLW